MRLQDKLNSIPTDLTVNALHQMLDPAKVKVQISWFGQRLVSIKGYEGSVSIHQLAEKYLKSSPFTQKSPGLQERVDCYKLWKKVEKLCDQSDEELKKVCIIFRFFVFLREFRIGCAYSAYCAGDPIAVIGMGDMGGKRSNLFEFEREEFEKLWPNEIKECEEYYNPWLPNKVEEDMVVSSHRDSEEIKSENVITKVTVEPLKKEKSIFDFFKKYVGSLFHNNKETKGENEIIRCDANYDLAPLKKEKSIEMLCGKQYIATEKMMEEAIKKQNEQVQEA